MKHKHKCPNPRTEMGKFEFRIRLRTADREANPYSVLMNADETMLYLVAKFGEKDKDGWHKLFDTPNEVIEIRAK
jgi:hypothetical protein